MLRPDEISDILVDIQDRLLPRIRESVVPIYIASDSNPQLLGSGNLLQVAETTFLVTAHHVVKDALNGRPRFSIAGV